MRLVAGTSPIVCVDLKDDFPGKLVFVGGVYGSRGQVRLVTLKANFVRDFFYDQGGLAPRVEEGIRFHGSFGCLYIDGDNLKQH